jgi:hypothetical protein
MKSKRILVHSMGKCGSQSVFLSLKNAGYPTLHCHYLVDVFRRADRDVLDALRQIGDAPLHIISLTREPMARNVSGWFANRYKGGPAKPIDVMEHYPHHVPLVWFDREMRGKWGLDIYKLGFIKRQGWQIYDCPPHRVLIIRLENLNDVWDTAFSKFTGEPAPDMIRAGQSKKRHFGSEYTRFRGFAQFPRYFLRYLYESRYMKTFYTDSEIEEFYRRWSAKE